MTNPERYRRKAAEQIALAQIAGSTAEKARILAVAELWLDIADRTEERPRVGQYIGKAPAANDRECNG